MKSWHVYTAVTRVYTMDVECDDPREALQRAQETPLRQMTLTTTDEENRDDIDLDRLDIESALSDSDKICCNSCGNDATNCDCEPAEREQYDGDETE